MKNLSQMTRASSVLGVRLVYLARLDRSCNDTCFLPIPNYETASAARVQLCSRTQGPSVRHTRRRQVLSGRMGMSGCVVRVESMCWPSEELEFVRLFDSVHRHVFGAVVLRFQAGQVDQGDLLA